MLSSSSSISCALCRPSAKERLGRLSMSIHADWHLPHHTLDSTLSEHKTCMSYPLSIFFLYSGCRRSYPWGMWALEWSQVQSPSKCPLFDLGSCHWEPARQPAAGILGIQVQGSPWSPLGWVSSYQLAAVSAARLAELAGAARQEKAAAWAGWQLVMPQWSTCCWQRSQLRLDYKGQEPVLFITANIWKRGYCGVKSTNCNNGLFLVMYSEPWRTVGLRTVVSVSYIEWILPVRVDCLFDRFTKVPNEKNAADAE